MDKIISFCKTKYKILIPVMVIIVLLITVFFLWREYKYDNYRNKKEVDVFQYFGGIKTEYTAIVTYNLKNAIIDVNAKNKKIEYDATPIYYKDTDEILFTTEMSIVFPLREGSQYKLYKYSMYSLDENLHHIKNNVDSGTYNYFFLYDGDGLFFFPDAIKIKVGKNKTIDLGPMSYVSLVGGYTLIYYDRDSDKSEIIELDNDIITAVNDQIEINLSEKYCLSFGNKVLLFGPNNLKPVFKTD